MLNVEFDGVPVLKSLKKRQLKQQLFQLIEQEGKKMGDVSIVFCSDEHLLEVNRKYLNHDYYTDIITFDYSKDKLVSGDLIISLDRLRENAGVIQVSLNHELHRVVFHGVLHLCGYKDKMKSDKVQMTSKENFYLQFFQIA